MPVLPVVNEDSVCCGGPPPPKSSPDALPGYDLCDYVLRFTEHNTNKIAIVSTTPTAKDRFGTLLARVGISRNGYTVSPGLYGVGTPDEQSPVLVTANYKLSFDTVRFNVEGHDFWLLVLDTCGINVWCGAGKGTFSTDELVLQIQKASLHSIVSHRQVIVPQLGAVGVSAFEVKKRCGFAVTYGPIRATDIATFLNNEGVADGAMRSVTFRFTERAVLIPVELYLLKRILWWLIPLIFLISGFTTDFISITKALTRGLQLLSALGVGIVSGAIIVPLLLPFLPGKTFSFKGGICGALFGTFFISLVHGSLTAVEIAAVMLWITSVSSYLAMNFTGSTPFTSASGVEWEMKRAIPLQIMTTLLAITFWVAAPFV